MLLCLKHKSHPAWDAWIEITLGLFVIKNSSVSHPAWDAWIEISPKTAMSCRKTRRIPHGMRGLKYSAPSISASLPTSHPAWDAWIEIFRLCALFLFCNSRIPHGMRGLKLSVYCYFSHDLTVASRMGCVD